MVEVSISEIPHSSNFVFSGRINITEPGGAGIDLPIYNNSESDRILFYISAAVGVSTTALTITIQDNLTSTNNTTLTKFFHQFNTTEAQTTAAPNTTINATANGNVYNGLVTGNVLIWPAKTYLRFIGPAVTARTWTVEFGYWEVPLRG